MTLFQRINRRIDTSTDCWIWTGPLNVKGYARTFANGSRQMVHRVTYELWRGPIPEGLQLDHLCRNRACCRPDHLEAVTLQENISRGEAGKHWRDKTHCPSGHPYDEGNTYLTPNRERRCVTCMRASSREYMRKRRAAGRFLAIQPAVVSPPHPCRMPGCMVPVIHAHGGEGGPYDPAPPQPMKEPSDEPA